MKTILCFGDSNTWGWKPCDKSRYGLDERWPGVLRREIGSGFWVVEEGLNGRTTVVDDPIEDERCGKRFLPACLLTHKPIDLVIVMLGTNDIKKKFSQTPFDIAKGLEALIKIIRKSESGPGGSMPKILAICPPPVKCVGEMAEMLEGGDEKSKNLPKYYKMMADLYGCDFLDAGEYIATSDIDGVHLEVSEHQKLGLKVAEKVKKIFSE